MKNLIHRITTDIKFLYPCLAHGEEGAERELVITTETKLFKVYPVERKVLGMESVGEDYWGRYSFRDEKGQYYCEVDGVLYFKGNDMEGEPHYPVKEAIHYEYPDIDSQLIEFSPYISKVKKYLKDNEDLKIELVETATSLKINSDNMLESKIICQYRFKVNS